MAAAKKAVPKTSQTVEKKTPVVKTTDKKKQVNATTTTPTPTASVETTKPTKTQQSTTEPTENNIVANVNDEFTQFINKFQVMISQFSTLKTELRSLEKKTTKELKIAQKLTNKKKRKGTRAPSGFVKPAPISDELADFLGLNHGSEMARTDVTREINKYIREHSLQDSNNGRKINPDKKLSQLLNVTPDIELTYFNLQKYMGPHFPKKIVEAAAASSS